MDEDLRALGALLTKPEPSEEVTARGRLRVRTAATACGPARRRRFGRPVASVAAVAAAATAAIAIFSVVTPDATPNGPPATARPAPSVASGRQVLLAAAVTAAARPAGSGTYWHVKMVNTDRRGTQDTETWTRRDGREWTRSGSGPVELAHGWPEAFTVAATLLSFQQIQRLPADPAALQAKLLRMIAAGRVPARDYAAGPARTTFLFQSLTVLLTEMPAPPKVRAAAFRALASLPGVTRAGTAPGGQNLLVRYGEGDLDMRMVIDPATSQVRGWTAAPSPAPGRSRPATPRRSAALASMTWSVSIPVAEWTAERPRN